MTKKLWFQAGVGILLTILIIKFFIDIYWIFTPIVIIFTTILVPLLLGGVLFYITHPVLQFLERKGMKRWASISSILVLLLAVVTALVFMIGSPVSKQIENLVEASPTIAKEIQLAADYVLENKQSFPPQVGEFIDNIANSIQNYIVMASSFVVSFISNTVTVTLTLVLVPFFFIYMLKDHEKLAPRIYGVFSGKTRTWIQQTLTDMNAVLKSYVQGQVLISFLLAVMMFIGYLIIRLDYALLLAIFAFFMNMIPFIGPWISLVPALIVALIQDPILVVWVGVITLVAQQVESNLITPNIMGKSLDIHPLTVISLVLAAGNIAGFIGIIIAIPTYAILKVIVVNLFKSRQHISDTLSKEV